MNTENKTIAVPSLKKLIAFALLYLCFGIACLWSGFSYNGSLAPFEFLNTGTGNSAGAIALFAMLLFSAIIFGAYLQSIFVLLFGLFVSCCFAPFNLSFPNILVFFYGCGAIALFDAISTLKMASTLHPDLESASSN
jgi:hypothetical protein